MGADAAGREARLRPTSRRPAAPKDQASDTADRIGEPIAST
jgi:hypothetical protein